MNVGVDFERELRILLGEIYGSQAGVRLAQKVSDRLRVHAQKSEQMVRELDASYLMLITYGDAITASGEMLPYLQSSLVSAWLN